MSRQAVYHKEDKAYRVACVGNDRWVMQWLANGHVASNKRDPWENQHKPTTYDRAVQVMYQRKPIKQAA